MTSTTEHLQAALTSPDASVRLAAAMQAGARPDPTLLEVLVGRCGVEPDFFVRDMLTWALTRQPRQPVVDRVLRDLTSPRPRTRSQALHTLSKVADPRAWPAVAALLTDPDDEVARTAWRTAVLLVPAGEEDALVEVLLTQLGRGDGDVRLSLSRVLVDLGEHAADAVHRLASHPDEAVQDHAAATEALARDPAAGSAGAVAAARRARALQGAPLTGQERL